MALTELKIKSLKPRKSRYLLADGQGLYIAVMPTGEKYWYVRSWKNGRESKVSIGKYPDISLKEARDLAHEERSPKAKAVRLADVVEEWLTVKYAPSVTPRTLVNTKIYMSYIVSSIGHLNIADITPPDVLQFARKVQQEHSAMVGNRVRALLSRVFRFAVASGLCRYNPAADIGDALAPSAPSVSRAPDDPIEALRVVLPAVRSMKKAIRRCVLLFIAYTFVRVGEAVSIQWSDIDGDILTIPAERMKMRRPHVVPLSRQALSVLDEMRSLKTSSKYVFPTFSPNRHRNANGITNYLCRMKLPVRFSPHSFRGCASTILNENGFRPDIIEMQLAHAEHNSVRAAYNKAQYLDERRTMMQWYADFIDSL